MCLKRISVFNYRVINKENGHNMSMVEIYSVCDYKNQSIKQETHKINDIWL